MDVSVIMPCLLQLDAKARAEVRRAKNRWLYSLAEQADLGRSSCNGASVWASIRTIQRSYQGTVYPASYRFHY